MLAMVYEQGIVSALAALSGASQGGCWTPFYIHAANVHDEKTSGVNWTDTASIKQMLQNDPTLQPCSRDLMIESARRLGWVSLDGKIPIDHLAALYAERPNDNRFLYQLFTKRKENANYARSDVTPRQVTWFDIDHTKSMKSGCLASTQKTVYWLATSRYGLEDWLECKGVAYDEAARIHNEGVIQTLGYAGMSGSEMIFAELNNDFTRINESLTPKPM